MASNAFMPAVHRGRNFLHAPGPTTVPERVLAAMQRPAVELSVPWFQDMCVTCLADLKPVFGTRGAIVAYAANGHGGWEAALVNALSPGDRVLVFHQGHFSAGWMHMAASLGLDVQAIEGDWCAAPDPQALEDALRADTGRAIRAVLLVQTDTASGINTDIAAMRRAMQAAGHPALLMVDAVASLATMPFQMDAWGVDVVVAGSQKGLMCPPGLAFNAVSERALAAAREATLPRNYWDWQHRLGELYYHWFGGTAPVHLVYGLREALDMLAEEGAEATHARHRRLAGALWAAVDHWSGAGEVSCAAPDPAVRSTAVTTIRIADGHDATAVIAHCRDRFDVGLGGGLGPFHGHCFRIAHMGYCNEAMLFGAIGAVEASLRSLGVACTPGGVSAAIETLL